MARRILMDRIIFKKFMKFWFFEGNACFDDSGKIEGSSIKGMFYFRNIYLFELDELALCILFSCQMQVYVMNRKSFAAA